MDNKNNNQQPIWQKPSMPEPQAPIRRSPNVQRPQQPVRQNAPVPRPQQPVRQNTPVPRPQQPVRQSPPVPKPQQPIRQAQPRAQQPIDRRQAQPRAQQPIDRRQAQPIAQQPIDRRQAQPIAQQPIDRRQAQPMAQQPIDRRQAQPGVQQPIDRRQVQNQLPSEYNKPLNGVQSPVQNASQVGTKPVSQPVNPVVDRKSKKQAKQHQKLQKKADGSGKKKGAKAAIAIALVFAIVVGIVGVAAAIIAGVGGGFNGFIDDGSGVSSGSANVETGAIADVTFRDNIAIISDTAKVQEDFVEVIVEGEEYTLNYGTALPQELSSLSQGDIFCVPSIKGADVNCFAMGFCGEVISSTSDSITFKVPSMEEVFSDFSFHLQGDIAESAEFVPAAGVSVIENKPITKGSFTPLTATMPNVTLAKHADYNSEVTIGDYTIKPGFSYVNPTQKSILPGYTMLCDNLKLDFELKKKVSGSKKKAISGTVEMEDIATKMDIEWHEDDYGNLVIDDFDVGVMANTKTKIKYSDTISFGLDDLEDAISPKDLLPRGEVIEISDTLDNEDGKIVIGSYLIGFDVDLPGFINKDNKVSYLSAGIIIQFFITANGELSAECSLSNEGFYRAEFNADTGFFGEAKSYDYPSPALYTGYYEEEWENSNPTTTIEVEGQLKLNGATGIDVGICFLGMVPLKLSNNFADVEMIFDLEGKKKIVDLSDADKSFLFEYADSVIAKSNSTLKLYLGAKVKMNTEMTHMAFGLERVLYDKVWYQYPDPIPFDYSQCGFGNIFVGETYTETEMDEIYKAFEKEKGINSALSDFKDGVGNAVLDTFKYEMNSVFSQLDIEMHEEDNGTVKYYSSGAMYFLDADGKVVMSVITGEKICNAGGLSVNTKIENVEKLYSAPDDSATINLEISQELRGILKQMGIDFSGIENMNLTVHSYVVEGTEEEMILLYTDGTLKAIIVNA